QLASTNEVPVAVAAIPAELDPSLVDAVARCAQVTVVQHGYAHRNHAPPGARKCELGVHRPSEVVIAELAIGMEILERAFAERFSALLVPPWNRIDAAVTAQLPTARLHGLSTFGSRSAVQPVPGIVQCNTHVDLIAWRKDRAFIGADAAIDQLVGHLSARREGGVDAGEPTGILTHHLNFEPAAWEFLALLVARTRQHEAAIWLDVAEALRLDAAAPAASGPTT
ncbi:MAG: hypothetical protein ABIQ29_09865, partial [Burkholderiaceae bacterium]